MNTDKLNAHIQDFDQKYQYSHPTMTNMVHSLLAEEEANRPTSDQLLGMARYNAPVKVQSYPQQLPQQVQTVVHTSNNDFFDQGQRILNTTPKTTVTTQSNSKIINTSETNPTTTYTTSKVYYNQQPTTTYVQNQP